MSKTLCPKCWLTVNTKRQHVKPKGELFTPKEYGEGTYHYECYVAAMKRRWAA